MNGKPGDHPITALMVHHIAVYGEPSGAADADFVTFGMATEYLGAVVDNEWTNQTVFGQHPTVSRSNRTGRAFMRAEPTEADERFRNQERTLRIAELLFNLQNVEGIDARLEDLRFGRAPLW